MEEDEIGETCCTHGIDEKFIDFRSSTVLPKEYKTL
jgi:hypothetical protein